MTASPMRRRLRSGAVALGLTGVVASSLTGCGFEDEPDYAAICVDPQTNQRVDDDQCQDDAEYHGGGGFYWFYMSTAGSHRVPAVGSRFEPSIGTYQVSSLRAAGGSEASVQRGGLPAEGSSSMKSYTRSGGFGSRGGFHSSHGGFGG